MINKSSLLSLVVVLALALIPTDTYGQQDPQYTHYMYNTLSINPAYAGQRETLSIVGLHRSQWVGVEGAPQTQSLGIHSPLRNERLALGLNVVTDALGPARESFVDANFSYTFPINDNNTKLSFGVKAGWHNISTDWSKGQFQNPDVVFNENISQNALIIGAGLYLSNRNWYVGLSAPNFLTTDHYDDFQESLATERMHFFLTGGYVFNLNDNVKLKPAFLVKAVSGAPLIADISANALFDDTLTLGLAWRWDDSISALAGFQVTKGLYIGYGYDLTTSDLNNYNSGTHELILRFELQQLGKILSPRFF
ncbi:PorP/SprF family type IX secretion system membrane protein [Winogradskyella jejuensis]|uniref:Type IX secretion system membrane protein, PorP/SprF family n=1 Tax=Winogradskyella jejuensis TaxID=1089305 RepID=A0A1M5K3S8_9FLAO|nr:type IX secretion system membrane protein PorP/SprF [Winogradskyella jejuensis]SHG47437.1 type IX secretion system membrane protein, PorP/SprF family [Winogradskyella jejuensis]